MSTLSVANITGQPTSNLGIINVTTLNVGANVVVNTSTFAVGNSSVNTTHTATGITFGDASQIGSASSLGVRNRIINGGMDVWQRGTSFSSIAAGTYTADRFAPTLSGVSVTVTQDTGVPNVNFKYSLKMVPTSNTTPSECALRQFIEQQNVFDLAGKTVTGSAWVYTNKSSIKFRVAAMNSTGNGDISVTINLTPNTWTKISSTFTSFSAITAWTGGTNVQGAHVDIGFVDSTPVTTSDYIYVTGVQLETGSVATPFDRRPYGMELALCQRYYSGPLFCSVGGFTSSGIGMYATYNFPVTMRANPTTVTSGVALVGSCTGFSVAEAYNNGIKVVATNTTGGSGIATMNVAASAEL